MLCSSHLLVIRGESDSYLLIVPRIELIRFYMSSEKRPNVFAFGNLDLKPQKRFCLDATELSLFKLKTAPLYLLVKFLKRPI